MEVMVSGSRSWPVVVVKDGGGRLASGGRRKWWPKVANNGHWRLVLEIG